MSIDPNAPMGNGAPVTSADSTESQITPNPNPSGDTPQPNAPAAPVAGSTADLEANALASRQMPSPQTTPQAPILQHAPADNSPKASLHARLFDGILQTMSGGPVKVLQSDPTTGETREVEVPQSRTKMADSIIAGVLTSLFSGSQGRGASPDFKPVMGAQGTQHAEQQAAEQAKIDQMQDRKMKVVKSNMETIQSQLASARMGDEVMDKQIADGKTVVDLGRTYDANKSPDEPLSIQKENLTHDAALDELKKSNMQYIAVPSGKTSHLDPATGKMVTEPTYSIVDPHVKVKLNEDDVKMLASTNPSWADAWKQSGGNIEIPLDVVNSERLVRSKANNVQAGINQITSDPAAAKALGFDPSKAGKLMDIMQDRNLREAVANTEAQMAAHAGSDRHYSILDAMLTSDGGPALAQKLGIDPAKANAWLDQQHRDRIAADKLAEGGLGDKAPADPAAVAQIPVLAKQMGLTPAEVATASAELPKTGATRADVAKVLENIRHQHDTNAQLAAGANRDSGDPAMIERVARNLVDNPSSLTTMRDIGTRGTQRLAIIDKAEQIAKAEGKTFDTGLINQRVKFLEQYEDPKGKAAINRQAINNILQHSADVSDLNQLNRRSNVKILNTPINALKDQFGDQVYTQYQTATGVLKDELGLYFAGGYSPTKDQQAMWEKIQANTATPAQTEAFAKEIGRLAARRADTFNQQFKTNMGYDDPNMITPQAKSAAERLGLGDAVSQFKSGGQLGGPVVDTKPKMVSVQIPGQKPGAISADKIDAFKKKYPNAIIGQGQ